MPQVAQSSTIPAPVGGWNTRDPLDLMDEQDAPRLVNLFPDGNNVVMRNGYRIFQTVPNGSTIETLAECVDALTGTRYLLSALLVEVDDDVYRPCIFVSTEETGPDNLTDEDFYQAYPAYPEPLTSSRWQTINVKTPAGTTRVLFFNGADPPLYYEAGASTMAPIDFTGTDPNAETLEPTDNNDVELIAATTYRNRVYMIQAGRTWFWYTGVEAVAGACDYFDVGSIFQLGGAIQNIGTWTIDAGNGIDEHLVIISEMGEGLVYAGANPGDSTWNLVGRFYLPPPIGRRALVNLGTNLVVITTDGVMPLSQALFSTEETGTYKGLSDKIKPTFSKSARDHGSNWGWQGLVYPRGKYALFNIPIVEGGQARQYVMNLQTGAWAEFRNQNALCWGLLNNKPYFGGADGIIYEADYGTSSDNSDNGASIEWQAKIAFNYFENRSNLKQFTMGRPVLTSTSDVKMTFDIDVDFSDKTITSLVSVTGSGTPWGSPWGSPWAAAIKQNQRWYGVAGLGRCAAIRMGGSYKNVLFSMSAIHINFTPGGLI